MQEPLIILRVAFCLLLVLGAALYFWARDRHRRPRR